MNDGTPHRVIDNILNGFADGFQGLVDSGANAIKNAGKRVMGAVNTPFKEITGVDGPLEMVDKAADGFVDAGVNFVDRGIIDSAKTAKEGVMRALDQAPEQIGIPPKLGMFQVFGKKK
jgi:hypothetical protein